VPRRVKETAMDSRPRTAPAGKRERAGKAAPAKPKRTAPAPRRSTSSQTTTLFIPDWSETVVALNSAVTQFIRYSGTATATTMNDAWPFWITDNSTCTATGHAVWTEWQRPMRGYAEEHRAVIDAAIRAQGRVSPEARARIEARDRAYAEEARKAQLQREAANRKAEILLRSLLSPEQIRDLESKHHFFMRDKHGRLYRIDRGQHGNVKLLDRDLRVVESYCIQPRGGLPDADAMAAQKLLLEADPEHFHQVANVSAPTGQLIRRGGGPQRGFVDLPELPPIQVPQIPQIQL
jgi:hypothetical protein